MKKHLLVISYWLLVAVAAWAGTTADPSRVLFGARQLGMGGVSIGFSNDANGVFSNPAGLNGLEYPQLTATSRKLLLDETQYSLAGLVIPFDFGTIGIGYVGMGTAGSIPTNLDPATGRIIQNPSVEAGSYSNSVLALSYSRALTAPLKISLGGNLKFFTQALSGGGVSDKGTGTSLDLCAAYRPLPWLTVGASLQNLLGGSIKWNSSEDKLGGYYKLGAGINIWGASEEALISNPQKIQAGIDIDLPNSVLSAGNSMLMHAGVEYFPMKTVAVRAGLNQESGGTGLCLGVGMVNGGFRFDYAFAQRPGLPGDNPHYFTLSYVGERVMTTDKYLKVKKAHLKFLHPRDRFITDQNTIDVSAEVWGERVIERKRIWTVTAVSATFDVFDMTEKEDLYQAYLNGKKLDKLGTIEAREELKLGRNVIQLIGYTTPEITPDKRVIQSAAFSSEARVLQIIPFKDTPMDLWAIEPISLNVTLGLVNGYPDNTFKPEKGITRAELVTLLVRSQGVPQEVVDQYGTEEIFSDVNPKHWAAKYIGYGSSIKLVTGYVDGTFKPNKVLNRAEGVTILARYAGLIEELITESPFPDVKVDFWANKYISSAKKAGMLKYLAGKDFNPSAEFTRAEACEVLYQVPTIQRKVDEFWEVGIVSALPPATPKKTEPATSEAR